MCLTRKIRALPLMECPLLQRGASYTQKSWPDSISSLPRIRHWWESCANRPSAGSGSAHTLCWCLSEDSSSPQEGPSGRPSLAVTKVGLPHVVKVLSGLPQPPLPHCTGTVEDGCFRLLSVTSLRQSGGPKGATGCPRCLMLTRSLWPTGTRESECEDC